MQIMDSDGKQQEVFSPTSLDRLEKYAQGEVVSLPPFGGDMPFNARLTRPSLMYLCKCGIIPNQLLTKAADMFSHGTKAMASMDDNTMSDFYDILHAVAGASLVEPTLADIESAGLQLTDEQLMAIFNYSQNGVRALEQFRRQREMLKRNSNGPKGPRKTK